MKIFQITTNPDQKLTSPFRSTNGITLALRGGNILDPYFDPDGWFWSKKPSFVLNFYVPIPILPYITVKFGKYGFYAGFKAYGVDSDAYIDQLCPKEDVYEGSQALSFSVRFSQALNT